MIKPYIPVALMRVSADVVKKHPLADRGRRVSPEELHKLLERICSCSPENLSRLAASLLKKEIYALLEYLPHNSLHIPLNNITKVLSCRMKPEFYHVLFMEWQNFPADKAILNLLAEHDTKENHGINVVIPVGMFSELCNAGNIYREIIEFVNHEKYEEKFDVRFRRAGFSNKTFLYDRCYSVFLSSCNMNEFVTEGDQAVAECAEKASAERGTRIWLNLLTSGSNYHTALKSFKKCFEIMASIWKDPCLNKFPPNYPLALSAYKWLYNYYEMDEFFFRDTQQDRKNFWEKYLDLCTVTQLKKHDMLVFKFKGFYATEFKSMGPIYLYDQGYFENRLLPEINRSSVSTLRSTLFHDTNYLYRRAHNGMWEREVAFELRNRM